MSIRQQTIRVNKDVQTMGTAVEEVLKNWFFNTWVAVRAISSNDHPGISKGVLIDKIVEVGTDRYDQNRNSVHHDIDIEFGIELHAIPMYVSDTVTSPHYSGKRLSAGTPVGELLLDLREGGKADRGFSVSADVILVYDLDQLVPAPMHWNETTDEPEWYEGVISPTETTVYKFLDSDQKQQALVGVINIEAI